VTACDRLYVAQGRYVTLGRKAKRADDRDSCGDKLCRFYRDVFTLPRRGADIGNARVLLTTAWIGIS